MAKANPDKCPRCGAPRTGQFKYCPECGANFEALDKLQQPKPKKESARRRRWEIAAIVGLVIITAIIFNIYFAAKKHTEPMQTNQQEAQPQGLSAAMPMGDDLASIIQRGHQFMDAGQFGQAIPLYEKALSMDTLQPDIMVDLGACYHAVGDYNEATFQFLRALKQRPDHSIALFNMGVVAMTVADTASAKQWWNRFLEVAPDSPQAPTVRERLKNM